MTASIWIAIEGLIYQGGGTPVFYAASKEELLTAIRNRGFTPTDWEDLFEKSNKWIRAEPLFHASTLES